MGSRGHVLRVVLAVAHEGNGFGVLALDELREGDAGEEAGDGRVELLPQVVRHATLVLEAVLAAGALRRIEWLLHGTDDVGDGDRARLAREVVATAGAAHARDELAAPQLAEELLEIRERD